MTTHHLTAGGALIGLLAVASVLVPWYRRFGRKAPKDGQKAGGKGRNFAYLGPFTWTFVEGVLTSLATGGLMGKTAYAISAGSNTLGNKLLSSLAGATGPGVNRIGIAQLTPGGSVMLIIMLLGLGLWFWGSSRGVKLQMLMGLVGGVTLGPTAGIAGVTGVIISPIVNTFGGWLVGSA